MATKRVKERDSWDEYLCMDCGHRWLEGVGSGEFRPLTPLHEGLYISQFHDCNGFYSSNDKVAVERHGNYLEYICDKCQGKWLVDADGQSWQNPSEVDRKLRELRNSLSGWKAGTGFAIFSLVSVMLIYQCR
jgi:DNA-directed RNA polymerase subunit RPC12/RpoP